MSKEENPDELFVLMRVPSEIEAAPIVAALDAAGIPVTMTGGFTAGFIAEAPGDVQVKVFEKDRAKAEQIVADFKAENDTIDWSQIDVGDRED